MEKIDQFFQLWFTFEFVLTFTFAMIVTDIFCTVTRIWREPTGFKTGSLTVIAFIFGAIAMFIAK